MTTKKITLFYQVTQKEVTPPPILEIERKNRWVKDIQKTVEAEYKPKIIKTTYEEFNPEIENQWKFFNGTCVLYYAIQNMDCTGTSLPDNESLKMYRELLLDEVLGYDLKLVDRTIRKRKSTTDFRTVSRWNTFLKELQENVFDPAGYIFPDSKEFWELVKEVGYEQAKKISIEKLQSNLRSKN
jgi:hypothetical protein